MRNRVQASSSPLSLQHICFVREERMHLQVARACYLPDNFHPKLSSICTWMRNMILSSSPSLSSYCVLGREEGRRADCCVWFLCAGGDGGVM
jgi:hypothetical protein